MKKNHEKLQKLLSLALKECSYDNCFADVKKHLKIALDLVEKVSKKRTNRNAIDEYAKKAKSKNDEWWDLVKEGLKKLEELKDDEREDDRTAEF